LLSNTDIFRWMGSDMGLFLYRFNTMIVVTHAWSYCILFFVLESTCLFFYFNYEN